MINYKLRKPGIDFSIILVIRIVVRVLCLSIMFFFISDNTPKNATIFETYYFITSFTYYFLFLVMLDRYLKYSAKNRLNIETLWAGDNLQKLLSYAKWILLVFTAVLLLLTLKIMPIEWPVPIDKKILYVLTKIFPNVFGSNVSFIIINMLMFYASSIINISKRLKLEQELTI